MIFKSKFIKRRFLSHLSRDMFDAGYEKCLYNLNILWGDSAKKFLEEINDGEISVEQKKFLDDCEKVVK